MQVKQWSGLPDETEHENLHVEHNAVDEDLLLVSRDVAEEDDV